ncbi:MAG: tRNA (adenosine(37)-N6)-threonylcarbamoyltransferase complex ATPase subunit type 1 TsaE [Rhodospirillaceae bacterium]|jgi:tRNA threonylcarbamoyladenosine biosynthesis protein TsaE|nr:tRNA (adenosine(37)-N6)-threonylcarbamoyltransferase complex ATPase subunit type 1 TsaE [Rhodospirillaceae bacterium]
MIKSRNKISYLIKSKNPTIITIDLINEVATHHLAKLLTSAVTVGDIIALKGDLGSGKTSFIRAFIRALIKTNEYIPSPTFTFVQSYECTIGKICHFDLYRLKKPQDALELGLEEAFANSISLIEWSDRLGSNWLPVNHLAISLSIIDNQKARRVSLTGSEIWIYRLEKLFCD